jgi:hypothetical protein
MAAGAQRRPASEQRAVRKAGTSVWSLSGSIGGCRWILVAALRWKRYELREVEGKNFKL